ncbi:MAG: hypothetical protein C4316_13270 [Chloroflexota bacterium]
MKAGLLVLGQYPPERLVRIARLAEEWGYDYFWFADEKFYWDPWVGLTLVAVNTRRIRLGPGVTEPYARHPALTAMAAASLACVAPGRTVLGIGAGGPGFPELGVERVRPAVAIPEAVELIRRLWAGGRVDYQGRVIRFRNGRLQVRPPQLVPIFVAARGPKMIGAAARVGDGVIIAPYASPPGVAYAQDLIEKALRAAGRSRSELEVALRVDLAVARCRAEAVEAARYWVALPLWVSYPDWSYLKPLGHLAVPKAARELIAQRDYGLLPEIAGMLPEAFVAELAVAGTPEEVGGRFRAIARQGVDQLIIHPVPTGDFGLEETIRYFAQEILGSLRREV